MLRLAWVLVVAISLAAAPPDPNQEKFEALVKELGSAVQASAAQGNPKLRSMVQAGTAARLNELNQFLKGLGPDAARLRLTDNPLAKLAFRLEAGKQILATGSDPANRAIALCEAALKEQDPLLREGALQKLERHLRSMGERQEALPDEAMISTDITLTLDIEELFLSPAKNIRLVELPNQNLKDLYARLLKTRAQLVKAQDENIAWLAEQQKSFGEFLAAAGILPQGTFLGRAELTDGTVTIFDSGRHSQGKIPRQVYLAQVKMILAGTQVQGVITFGEGEDRSAARLKGTFDPATNTVQFQAVDPTLRGLPGLAIEEFKIEGTGQVKSSASLAGDFQLALNLSAEWVGELGEKQTGRIVASARGVWQVNR